MITRTLPGPAGLDGLIDLPAGTPVHVIEITDEQGRPLGNNGDKLMHRVFEHYLADRGLRRVAPADATAMLLQPNGALLEKYRFPDILARRLHALPDLPFYMFPSSALFETRDPSFLFEGRTSPTTWILREEPSYEHLSERWESSLSKHNVRLVLDHDIVASGHQWVRDALDSVRAETRPLVAARIDFERAGSAGSDKSAPESGESAPGSDKSASAAMRRVGSAVIGKVRAVAPDSTVRTRVERGLRTRQRNHDLGRTLETLARRVPDFEAATWENAFCADISRPDLATYAEYSTLLANADQVVTDRLHVGLPAAVLGKRVFLLEGSYHKIGGVYRRSLAAADNVTLISD